MSCLITLCSNCSKHDHICLLSLFTLQILQAKFAGPQRRGALFLELLAFTRHVHLLYFVLTQQKNFSQILAFIKNYKVFYIICNWENCHELQKKFAKSIKYSATESISGLLEHVVWVGGVNFLLSSCANEPASWKHRAYLFPVYLWSSVCCNRHGNLPLTLQLSRFQAITAESKMQ